MDFDAFAQNFAGLFPDMPADDLSPETVLADLPQWDSLGVLLVLSYADEQFNRQLNGKELQACSTMNDLYHKVVPGGSWDEALPNGKLNSDS